MLNSCWHVGRLSAAEAERAGLVSRVVPQDQLLPEAYKLAAKIGALSAPVIAKAKDCVHRAYEMSLGEGLRYEQCVLSFEYSLPSLQVVVYLCDEADGMSFTASRAKGCTSNMQA